MDSKPMHTSHRGYLYVHMVTNFKPQGPSPIVRISFLTVLSCFQMTLNNTDLFSCFVGFINLGSPMGPLPSRSSAQQTALQ